MDKRDMEQPRARAHDTDKDQGIEQESGGKQEQEHRTLWPENVWGMGTNERMNGNE